MPSTLLPSEHEEKQVESLIDKKPAPSRKPAERRGPKHDNRKDRIQEVDPDMGSGDKDMSLNYKSSATRLSDIALSITLAASKDERPKKDPEKPKKTPAPAPSKTLPVEKRPGANAPTPPAKPKETPTKVPKPEKPKKTLKPKVGPKDPNRASTNKEGLRKSISEYEKNLRELSPVVADSFVKYTNDKWLEPLEWEDDASAESSYAEHWHQVNELEKSTDAQSRKLSSKISALDPEEIPSFIASTWPNGKMTEWPTRAAIIDAVKDRMDKTKLPASFKAPFLRAGSKANDKDLIKAIVDDVGSDFSMKNVMRGDAATFGVLTAIYKIVSKNPPKIDANKLASEVEDIRKTIDGQISDLLAAMKFMEHWEESMKASKKHSVNDTDSYKPDTDSFGKAEKEVENFFHSSKPIVDPRQLMADFEKKLVDKYGEIPKALKPAFGKAHATASGAASYDVVVRKAMVQKSASYHGVVKQGHPSGETNTGYNSYDKRYFGKEHYASILKVAKEFLSEDWLKHGWEGSVSDAQIRAALDLAIHTADSNLYQSKIDSETYDMLLNRLAGWDHDSFSETVIPSPTGSKRSASEMKTQYENIARIANKLRKTDPRRALAVMQSLRKMVAQDQAGLVASPEAVATPAAPMAAPAAPAVAQGDQNNPQGMLPPPAPETAQMSDSGAPESDSDTSDLKSKTQKLVDAKDMDDFLAGLKDLQKVTQKTAAGRIAAELAPLEDMSDEEVMAFLKDQKAKGGDMLKALESDDMDTFTKHLDDMSKGVEDAAKLVKTGSVRVNLSTLVRLAMSNPEAARVLMPVLVAAKKKLDKKKKKPAQTSQKKDDAKDDKKDAKTSQKKENPFAKKDGKDSKKDDKKGGKAPPFGGKKAPPFGGKGGKKTSQKRKASIDISDTEW